MNDNFDEAIIMLSKLTHRVSNITIFAIIIIFIFILGPFSITQLTKKFIKIILIIILLIILYTNYTGIHNIESAFRSDIENNERWANISNHITYNYLYSSMLGVFIIYLMYSCI